MYYLKNTNFWMFGLFFFFYFFIMGAYFPFFPIWLHDTTISAKVIRVLFLLLFLCSRYYSNRCLVCFLTNSGCANTCCGLLPAC